MTNNKYIKILEITNFKNFSGKTTFEFAQGLNVIVGENGSGKSNILESIDFVLGNKIARSQTNNDLFSSANKSSVITVRFIMNTGESITRELKKISNNKTQSKYFINDKPVLKAVTRRFFKEVNYEIIDDCGMELSKDKILIYAENLNLKAKNNQIIVVSNRNEIIDIADKVINITKKDEK